MTKLTVARALTAHVAKRFIRLATLVACGIFIAVFLLSALLVHFFSAWWWLLLLPAIFVLLLFGVIRLIMLLIVGRIHNERLNERQAAGLDDFVGKIEQIVEARATPLPLFALICLKDLVLHKDITTIKKLISDSAGLRKDYSELERLFS